MHTTEHVAEPSGAATDELQQIAHRAAVSDELETFTGAVAHEMRTHLQAVQGYAAELHTDYADQLDAQGRSYLERLQQASGALTGLVEELLGMARIARTEMVRTDVNLSGLARVLVREQREADPTHSVEVQVAPGIRARCDPQLMRVALKALLERGWKRTREHAGTRLHFGARGRNGDRAFFVGDSAPAEQLFDETAAEPAASVGLAVARRIVERHGGQLWVEQSAGGVLQLFSLR